MKIKITLLALMISILNSHAQQTKILPLKIGDKIPDFVFEDLKNTSKRAQKASDLYKHGLLIINFWATWCVPCVREMPYLDSLQNQKADIFKMICFTNQNTDQVSKYLSRNPGIKNLVISANDTKMIKYFPHRVLPHNVWIDRSGIIRDITSDDQINAKNIQAFINGNENLERKTEDLTFDYNKLLKIADSEFMYRSVITPYKNIGNAGVFNLDTAHHGTRFLAWNRTITDLLWNAYMKRTMDDYDWHLVELHTVDSTKFLYPKFINEEGWQRKYALEFKDWARKNEYCYELYYRGKISQDELYAQMASDLSKVFHVKVEIIFKQARGYIITALPGATVIEDKGNENIAYSFKSSILTARGQTVKMIIKDLNAYNPEEPRFVDQTNIKFPIALNHDFGDISNGLTIKMLKDYFNTIGLDINEGIASQPFLRIEDN